MGNIAGQLARTYLTKRQRRLVASQPLPPLAEVAHQPSVRNTPNPVRLPRRRRRRRGPRSAQTSANPSVSSVANIGANGLRVRGSEISTTAPKGDAKVVTITFSPGKTGCAQLDKQGGIFDRWTLNSCTIKYIGTASVTSGFTVYVGLDYGAIPSTMYTYDKIPALNPHRVGPAYKTFSIRQNKSAMPTKYLACNSTGGGAAVFHIVVAVTGGTSTDAPGYIEITYDIDLSYPHP